MKPEVKVSQSVSRTGAVDKYVLKLSIWKM